MEIKIEFADAKPNANCDTLWDYPLDEIGYLFQSIKDGDRENNSTFIFYDNRLYEKEI